MPKIFEYSYLVHYDITNIFLFVFGQKYDPEYIRIYIRIWPKKKLFAKHWLPILVVRFPGSKDTKFIAVVFDG